MAMVFPTSPTVGQVFTSGGRSWVWNGSAWDAPSATNVLQVPFGLTLISNTTVTATPAVIIDNIFTSEYQNYRINIKFTASSASMNMEPRASGTTVSGNFHTAILGLNYLGGATNILQTNTAFAQINNGYSNARGANVIEVFGPTAAAETSYLVYAIGETTRVGSTSQINNEVVTGLRFSTGNGTNFSANIRVYGYRN